MINSNRILNGDVAVEEETDTDLLLRLLEQLGIESSNEDVYKLILWNDEVNDMEYVVKALSEICKLNTQECMIVMLEAHTKGRAVAKAGSYEEMMKMKQGLNDRKIEATVET